MKRINTKPLFTACATLAMIMTGCNNAEYSTLDNAIYWEEASNAAAINVTADPQNPITSAITARLGSILTENVEAEIVIDEEYLKQYNELNKTEYEVIPKENVSFEKKIVIPAGEIAAETTLFTIKPYSTANGEQYAVPIKINVTKGNVSPIGDSNRFILLLNQPLIQQVPILVTSNMATTDTENAKWGETVSEWTIEAWVQMDGFNMNNQAIINSGGSGTEVYIRFGDAPIPYSSLQIKTQDSQVNTITEFTPNKWYHIAFTYDVSGLVTIYVNGQKDVTVQTKGGSANFDQMQIVSSGSWFVNRCMMAQLRLWNFAMGQTQIQSNMYYAAKPTNPNLMGYWKMDEGKENTFHDCTVNARHMTAGGTFNWSEPQRFDK